MRGASINSISTRLGDRCGVAKVGVEIGPPDGDVLVLGLASTAVADRTLRRAVGKTGIDGDIGFHLFAESFGGDTMALNVVAGNGRVSAALMSRFKNLNSSSFAKDGERRSTGRAGSERQGRPPCGTADLPGNFRAACSFQGCRHKGWGTKGVHVQKRAGAQMTSLRSVAVDSDTYAAIRDGYAVPRWVRLVNKIERGREDGIVLGITELAAVYGEDGACSLVQPPTMDAQQQFLMTESSRNNSGRSRRTGST